MNTLTYEQIRYAFNRLQMIGDRDLPMRVSYAMSRTKNKYLKPEIETFKEQTQDVESNTEEFEKHLQKEVDVEAHNVSAQELEDEGIEPQTFVGLSFLFSEHSKLERRSEEFENRTLIPIINTFYRWSEMEFNSPEAILAVSAAIDAMRSDVSDVDKRLTDVTRRIRKAQDSEGEEEDVDEGLLETLQEEQEEILDETTEVTIVEFDLESIIDAEDDLKVSPNQIEVLDPFLK